MSFTRAINHDLTQILLGYKNMFGEAQWQQGLTSMPQEVRAPLQERYGI